MTERELKPGKLLYTMGEVAEMFDVNQSLIRFWEQKFKILKPKKNKKGNRLFTPKDIKNLDKIYFLVKEKGMTLSGAEKCLKEQGSSIERDAKIVRKLQEIKSMLLEVREELKDGKAVHDRNLPTEPQIRPGSLQTVGTGEINSETDLPPFTPQPLFDLEEENEINVSETKPDTKETKEIITPDSEAKDTMPDNKPLQQSLF